jgi:hypothetical protein
MDSGSFDFGGAEAGDSLISPLKREGGRGEIVGDAKDRTVIPNPISLLCILLERNFSLELVIVA